MSVMLCRLQFLADFNLLRKFLEMMLKISDSGKQDEFYNNSDKMYLKRILTWLHLQKMSLCDLISNILRLL